MGEYAQDANALILLIGVLLLLFKFFITGEIRYPVSNFTNHTFLIFLGWIFIGFVVNIPDVIPSYFKQTSGINRFLRQLFSLVLSSILFFVFYYNVISYVGKQKILILIRKTFLVSLIIVSIYGFLEFLILRAGLSQLIPLINLFDYIPFVDVRLDTRLERLSSITYEPPALAMYLITVAGWMFSYILTDKGLKKFIPTILVLSLALLSGSRTSLVVVLFQFIVFLINIFSLKKYSKLVFRIFVGTCSIIFLISVFNYKTVREFVDEKSDSLDFTNMKDNVSNQSRLGIQYTSLLIFKENPVFGVGYGQQAFHAEHKYPYWAVKNNWEFEQKYLNERVRSFPPGYNVYTRLLAETGIIGLLLFVFFIWSFFYQANELKKDNQNKIMGIIIIVSMSGFTLNWLQIDSFRMYGVWLCLALLCFLYNKKKENTNVV
ncbi:O-antigen ligase family protein [Aquimarina sp. 2201CG14-23]|uniref:O-antigen ligase family protein n=1 Tax=Aquimarina mycalae TaxID=3040073 RepID=UPI002477F2B8|nr:O-antigen ligase family protein [Aquimarina sp. 2201CG14-23]MDH7446376.1 O-antigen ligase family protein [Aquimarina sp. 2201CG14-23]